MTEPSDLERRISALESRVEEVAADAAAARHLAAASHRDLADLTVKVEALRSAINALGVQTAERFTRLEARVADLEAQMRAGFTKTGRGFAEMRFRLDQVDAGQERILELLTRRDGT